MTEAAINVVVGPEPVEEAVAPAGHYYSTVKDRRILIKEINEGQSLMLGGYLRQINGPVDFESIMDIFGKLFLLLEHLIVEPEDMKWLEEQVLVGAVEVKDFAGIFHSRAKADSKGPAAVKKPRRGK
jgi:hypothetical protein